MSPADSTFPQTSHRLNNEATQDNLPARRKRHKMSHTNEPIVFKSPGLKPDTSLKVFDQEFQVHSTILKLHSVFFRTFLDSADKTPAPASAIFKYNYVSAVDDDGTWGLEAASKVCSSFFIYYSFNPHIF